MPQGLDAHIKEAYCTPSTPADFCYEGITPDQSSLLRNSNTGTLRNEVERWYTMWGVLFPDVPPPTSPYALRSVAAKQTAVAARKFLDANSTWKMMLEIFPNMGDTPESARAQQKGNIEHLLSCFLDFMDDQHEEVQESHKRGSQPDATLALETPAARYNSVSLLPQRVIQPFHSKVSDSFLLTDVQGVGHVSQPLRLCDPSADQVHPAAEPLEGYFNLGMDPSSVMEELCAFDWSVMENT